MERNILQCRDARKSEDPALASTPSHERICAELSHMQLEARHTSVEAVGCTIERGDCPVCKALQDALAPSWIDKWEDERYTELAEEVTLRASKITIVRVSILLDI